MAVFSLAIAIVTNALANLFIKLAASSKSTLASPQFWIGAILFGITLLFYSKALERYPLSVAYPIFVIGALALVVTFSVFILHERITGTQVLGFLFTILAIFFLTR